MKTRLTCTIGAMRAFQAASPRPRRRAATWASAWLNAEGNRADFVVCPDFPAAPAPVSAYPVLLRRLEFGDDVRGRTRQFDDFAAVQPPFLILDIHPDSTPAAWWVSDLDRPTRIDSIRWVGAGMRELGRGASTPLSARFREDRRSGRRSRTIGAFGGDANALARLQKSNFALVGCGRNGALLASHLAALGVEGRIALIDDDLIEDHNADAMGLREHRWVGERKVDAVADLIRSQFPAAEVDAIFESAGHPRALRAMVDSDVILCSVDHGEARTLCASVASSCLKPLIDVGTAILPDFDGWEFGCDVRLVLPGRCLLCWGGVDDLLMPRERNWFEQRAGSLRSLNSVGTGLAQLLLERLYADPHTENVWLQLRLGPRGLSTQQQHASAPEPDARRSSRCPICSRMALGPVAVGLDPGRWPSPR